MPGARHAACTVEMASVTRAVDVAVVDEVQMLADGGRGHAFTRALLGLPARTLHLCGDAAVLPLLRQLVADAGDSPWLPGPLPIRHAVVWCPRKKYGCIALLGLSSSTASAVMAKQILAAV